VGDSLPGHPANNPLIKPQAARYGVDRRLKMLMYLRVHSAYFVDDRLVSLAPETFQRAVRAIFLGRNLPDFLKAKVDAGNSRSDVR
jgi:hypothetical protein